MELQLQCGSKAMLYGNKKITNVCLLKKTTFNNITYIENNLNIKKQYYVAITCKKFKAYKVLCP